MIIDIILYHAIPWLWWP